jgi:hypothetical protein
MPVGTVRLSLHARGYSGAIEIGMGQKTLTVIAAHSQW